MLEAIRLRREIRWGSFIIAYCSGAYAISFVGPTQTYVKDVITWHEIDEQWIALQILSAIVLAIGALIPRRAMLHIGLVLSFFGWLSISILIAEDLDWSPGAFLFPFFAVTSMALLIDDVMRKPRGACA